MRKPIQAGRLRFPVHFYTDGPEKRDTATNERIPNPLSLGTRRTDINPIGGNELDHIMQLVPSTTHIVQMRYDSRIDAKCWFIYKNRRFDILYVLDIENRSRELKLYCVEHER